MIPALKNARSALAKRGAKETLLHFTGWGTEADDVYDLPEMIQEMLAEFSIELCSPQDSPCRAAISSCFGFLFSFFCFTL